MVLKENILYFFSAKRDIFPTRVFGSVEKLDDLITSSKESEEKSNKSASVINSGTSNLPPRCGSLGTKDLQNLKIDTNKGSSQLSPQINNRRFRMESSEFW